MNHSLAEEKREKWTSTDLEQKVAAQTKELAALNAIAAAVSPSMPAPWISTTRSPQSPA